MAAHMWKRSNKEKYILRQQDGGSEENSNQDPISYSGYTCVQIILGMPLSLIILLVISVLIEIHTLGELLTAMQHGVVFLIFVFPLTLVVFMIPALLMGGIQGLVAKYLGLERHLQGRLTAGLVALISYSVALGIVVGLQWKWMGMVGLSGMLSTLILSGKLPEPENDLHDGGEND